MRTYKDLKNGRSQWTWSLIFTNRLKSFQLLKIWIDSTNQGSAVSIPSNIAEGYGRNSNGECNRYLNISMGSLFEFQTQKQIALNLKYLEKSDGTALYGLSREIERMLSSFIRSLESK